MGQLRPRDLGVARPSRRPWPPAWTWLLAWLGLHTVVAAISADDFRLVVEEPAVAAEGGELQLAAGQALRLRCEGAARGRWLFPQSDEAELDAAPAPLLAEEAAPGGRWAGSLRLPNASYLHTGAYACVPHDQPTPAPAPAPAPAASAALYVYVADPEYPWVRGGVVPSWAMQYEEATLDCRPNNRSLRVRLLDAGMNEIALGAHEDAGWTLQWAPAVGFSMGPVNDRDAGIYFCRVDGWDDLMVNLNVMPRTTNLSPPTIHAVQALPHAVLGKAMELQCAVRVLTGHVFFHMEWLLPPHSAAAREGRLNTSTPTVHFDAGGVRVGTHNLSLVNVSESDAGDYTCLVTDHSKKAQNASFSLEVKHGKAYFIEVLPTDAEVLHQKVRRAHNATWVLSIVTFPTEPSLMWFAPDGRHLTPSMASKFPMHPRPRPRGLELTLAVLDVDLDVRGTYSLKVDTGVQERVVNLTLTVLAEPVVQLQLAPEPWARGARRRAWCGALGSPLPRVQWAWRPCPGLLRDCSPDGPYQLLEAPLASLSDVRANSSLELATNASGYLSCRASNILDDVNDTASVQVTDMPGPRTLEAWGPDPAVEGDDLRLWCGALLENHTALPQWRRVANGRPEAWDEKRFQVTRTNTSLSRRALLRIAPAAVADGGSYECFLADYEGSVVEYALDVKRQQSPFQRTVNINNTEWVVTPKEKLTLMCDFDGLPRPSITWYKDGKPFVLPESGNQFVLENDNKSLKMAFVLEGDQGEYRCRAANRLGAEERWVRLLLHNRKPFPVGMIILIVILVVLTIALVPLVVCVYKDWKRRRMMIAGLHHFAEGQPDVLNPELPADEQAELLPYDRKWEFPRERLRLGKQLGAGAFGVVLKAQAQGLVEGEEATTVAVKMVKRTANFSYLKALASELKIMVHLGRHLNVVNLLGACTGRLERHELLVIVEYCRFGNLHNYLLRHREGFVDQVDPRTGAVDAAIGADRLAQAHAQAHADADSAQRARGGRVKYASLSFSGSSDTTGGSDAGSEAGAPAPAGPVDYRAAAAAAAAAAPSVCVDSAGNETISMSPAGGEDGDGLTSSGSAQPHWRSNYRGDYRGGVRPICTRDLLCWAYQVARGMQYLARRKVLHGDLAARNILLADGNIVKICDFGLAKSMYKSDNYKKKGDGPLPVKWMALESIRDGVFSTQSDVWSFGVVLWELFSLAQTPYPGMAADERLYARLQAGYRMDKPPYATHHLYREMLHCWESNPVLRPSFEELAETLGTYLEESVRNHYLDLNNAYIDMNEQWRRDGATDYLGMLGAPDYSNLVAPREDDDPDYINRCGKVAQRHNFTQRELERVDPCLPGANPGCAFGRGQVKTQKHFFSERWQGTESNNVYLTYFIRIIHSFIKYH